MFIKSIRHTLEQAVTEPPNAGAFQAHYWGVAHDVLRYPSLTSLEVVAAAVAIVVARCNVGSLHPLRIDNGWIVTLTAEEYVKEE